MCEVNQRRGGSWATKTTWALVTTQPRGLTKNPEPLSRYGTGVTVFSAPAQRSVTWAPTSDTTTATAGLARSSISCSETSWAWAGVGISASATKRTAG